MRLRTLGSMIFVAGLTVGGPVLANSAADFYADMDEPHGTVVGWSKGASADIYEAHIIAINGNEIPGERAVVFLKPGQYTLSFRIEPKGYQPGPRDKFTRGKHKEFNKLELEVEAGKRYYVGGKFDRDASEFPWSMVVWKTESQNEK